MINYMAAPEGVDKATKIGTIQPYYCTYVRVQYKECEHRGVILGSKSKKGCSRVKSSGLWT